MEIKIDLDLPAIIGAAVAAERVQPIVDKAIAEAIKDAINDATGYRSAFREEIKRQLAEALLDGREYCQEITKEEEAQAKASGLVVVYGASDDLMEFRGTIDDELGAWDGTTAYLTSDGLLKNDCSDHDCPYFEKIKATAATIKAIWDRDGYSWLYETAIPHATFEIMEDGDTYCRGIVFALADVKGGAA